MNRPDVYTAVHKMQRARLFELVVEAGRADPADAVNAARLAGAVDHVADELSSHAEHEERFIHPLLRHKAPTIAARLEADHVELDLSLERLRGIADSYADDPGDPNELYRALAAFTGGYLGHLAVEEGEALPALWGECSDEELLGVFASFKGSRSDIENLTSLLAQLPAVNPVEMAFMVAVLGPVRAADLSEVLATLLSPMQLGSLRERQLT